jgi:hypothetical protein
MHLAYRARRLYSFVEGSTTEEKEDAPMRAPLVGAIAAIGIAFVATPPSASAAPLGGISKNSVQQTQTIDFSAQQNQQNQKKVKKGTGAKAGGKKPGGAVTGKKGGGGRAVGGGGGRPAGGGGGSNIGAAAAGAAIGLAIGIITTEAARQQAVQSCIDNHPSYNPNTGIWIDRHGRKHRCP